MARWLGLRLPVASKFRYRAMFAIFNPRIRNKSFVTAGTPAGFAAKKATTIIPIVLGANSDPVGVGLVASLARPGGNATGNSLMAPDLSAKRKGAGTLRFHQR